VATLDPRSYTLSLTAQVGKKLCFRGLSEARENINKKVLSSHPARRFLLGKYLLWGVKIGY